MGARVHVCRGPAPCGAKTLSYRVDGQAFSVGIERTTEMAPGA